MKNFLKTFILIVLLVISLSAFGCKKTADETSSATVNADADTSTTENADAETSDQDSSSESEVILQTANNYAAILGTYSSSDEPPYRNLSDLENYTTASLQTTYQELINANKDRASAEAFSGVTTTALSAALVKEQNDIKEVLVTVKQESRKSDLSLSDSTYKLLLIKFVKNQGSWKVDQADWQ